MTGVKNNLVVLFFGEVPHIALRLSLREVRVLRDAIGLSILRSTEVFEYKWSR